MESNFFNKEKQAKALKWLEEKWPKSKRQCEICGNEHWTLADDLVSPIVFHNNQIMLGGNIYPHFMVTCIKCGNSKTFNAKISDILQNLEGNNE